MSVLNEVLDDSLELICGMLTIQAVAESGDEARAMQMLALLKPRSEDLIPRLKGVLHAVVAAQTQAEQVRDLPKARVVCVAAFTGPQPDPHTANTQVPPPQSPTPIVA